MKHKPGQRGASDYFQRGSFSICLGGGAEDWNVQYRPAVPVEAGVRQLHGRGHTG